MEDLGDLGEGDVGGGLYSMVTGSSSFRLLLRLMAVCDCGFVFIIEFCFCLWTVPFVMGNGNKVEQEVMMTRCCR